MQPEKEKIFLKKRDTGRRPWDKRGRDWSDAATSQETPRIDGHHRRLDEAGRILPGRLQGDQSPVTS